MAKQVRTYISRHDGLNVGDEVRNWGDFVPEAAGWPNLRSYINVGQVEEVFVDQEEIDNWRQEFDARLAADSEPIDEIDDDEIEDPATPDSEEEEDDSETELTETPIEPKRAEPKKKPVKKTAKKTAKKTVRKKVKA